MPLKIFSLPEYHQAFERFSWQAMVELMKRKSPVLGMIQPEITEHVPSVRNTLPSGKIIESQPLELKMEFSVEVQDAIHGQFKSTIVAIDHAAEQAVKSVMEHFYAYHTRLCDAAGTKTDAKGQPISHDLMLASLEKVDIEFDQDGNALFPTMVMHPSMAEQLRRLPPPTENQIKAFNDLIERKRNDYASRRRDRRQSGHLKGRNMVASFGNSAVAYLMLPAKKNGHLQARSHATAPAVGNRDQLKFE